jgi:cytoskeletal protein RodZ
MGTATQHDPHAPHAAHAPHGTAAQPAPHDPERDIDAKTTTWWVVGWGVVFFITMWLMLVVFKRVQEHEIHKKVDSQPADELNDVRDHEREFLRGANKSRKTIDDAIKTIAPK